MIDWASALAAAVSGALGAVAGVILSVVLKPLFKPEHAAKVSTALTVVGAVSAITFLNPILERELGSNVRRIAGPPHEIEAALAELLSQPMFAALAEAEPERVDAFRAKFSDAYSRAGAEGLAAEAYQLGAEEGVYLVATYGPRARTEDLVDYVEAYVRVLEILEGEGGFLCHDLLFGALTGVSPETSRMPQDAIDIMLGDQSDAMASIVRNASDEPLASSVEDEELGAITRALSAELSNEQLRFVTGVRPPSAEDAEAACRASRILFMHLSNNPGPEGRVIRAMLTGSL